MTVEGVEEEGPGVDRMEVNTFLVEYLFRNIA